MLPTLEKIEEHIHNAFQQLVYAGLWASLPHRMRALMPANQNFHTPEPGPSLLDMYEERCLQAVLALMRTTRPTPEDEEFWQKTAGPDPENGIFEVEKQFDQDMYEREMVAYGKLRGEAETWCGSVAIMRNPYRIDKPTVAAEMRAKAQELIDEANAAWDQDHANATP